MKICSGRIISILLVGAASGGIATMLPAQVPGASNSGARDVTFRAGTQEVLVDAVVADKKGNFQRDLTRENFKILEDGKEQKITSFALGSPGGPRKHFIALVFDTEHPGLRDEVAQFVDRVASPDLYLAVFSRSGQQMLLRQAFTTDAGRIKTVLRAMEVTEGDADEIRNDLVRVEGYQVPRWSLESATLHRVDGVAQTLAPIRGKKALILFSEGYAAIRSAPNVVTRPVSGEPLVLRLAEPLLLARIARAQAVFDDCNNAGVSVYSFESGKNPGISYGNFYQLPEDRRQDHGAATDLVRDLAVFTGGKYTPPGDYDLVSYLGSLTAGQNDYYLLGYSPPADSADRPCHKIKVKVDRSGLEVNARDSYCTSIQVSAGALKPAQRALEERVASGAPGNIATGLQLSWFYSKPSRAVGDAALVDIAMDIDPAAMKMHGKLHGEFDVLGVAYHEDGSVAARVPDTVELDFDTPAQLSAFLKGPYHYSNQFNIAPGRYRFRMAAGGDQAFGSAERPLDIEAWSGKTMAVSGIALGTRDYALTDVTAELDGSMLEGPRRLASRGRMLAPMGGAQFHTGQKGMFYFEVYEPRLAQAADGQTLKPPAVRIRVLDRETRGEEADSGAMDAADWMQAGNPVIPIALTFPVSDLPAGSYTLEVRVTQDNGQGGVVRSADFEVK